LVFALVLFAYKRNNSKSAALLQVHLSCLVGTGYSQQLHFSGVTSPRTPAFRSVTSTILLTVSIKVRMDSNCMCTYQISHGEQMSGGVDTGMVGDALSSIYR
jgi:hypothetical protein